MVRYASRCPLRALPASQGSCGKPGGGQLPPQRAGCCPVEARNQRFDNHPFLHITGVLCGVGVTAPPARSMGKEMDPRVALLPHQSRSKVIDVGLGNRSQPPAVRSRPNPGRSARLPYICLRVSAYLAQSRPVCGPWLTDRLHCRSTVTYARNTGTAHCSCLKRRANDFCRRVYALTTGLSHYFEHRLSLE
jgi:hypothetical protein